ncbi:hypothetical protein B1759_15085 [Rubrivirga sp. SAORIC476]|uniref:hypothetical protein n=1 Tax=Rubrivirga sp. SAORIC476 TaxID=1961794 RepID=UPI000BA9676A|nr:hypothetical protein [Rubrivirga sp. SAORIC476]PAP79641.1 hypothetical protein B1759_15085 [Rubrivirga sp. SAORIC476]
MSGRPRCLAYRDALAKQATAHGIVKGLREQLREQLRPDAGQTQLVFDLLDSADTLLTDSAEVILGLQSTDETPT